MKFIFSNFPNSSIGILELTDDYDPPEKFDGLFLYGTAQEILQKVSKLLSPSELAFGLNCSEEELEEFLNGTKFPSIPIDHWFYVLSWLH